MTAAKRDFFFNQHGSICTLLPLTPCAKQWVEEHLCGDEVQTWGGAVVIEPRYAKDIIDGIHADGFIL